MKYAFFPGCVLEGAAKEAYMATIKVAEALGIELIELDGWTCCGASHAQDVSEAVALTVNARNIALAEAKGLPMLTVCNTCTLMLRKAKLELDNGQKAKVNTMLAPQGVQYEGSSAITHLLWVLVKDYGLENLQRKLLRPLHGLKVAGYYGCHILRPPHIMNFEDYRRPWSLEALIGALGAQSVDFDAKLECCGFHAFWTAEKDVLKMTGATNCSAITAGADVIVTPCPLCQMQLDMYQPEGKAVMKLAKDIPVLHLAQLVGLALGMSAGELGLNRHIVPSPASLTGTGMTKSTD